MTKHDKGVLTKILSKEDLEINIPKYSNYMINTEFEYALINLSLNYYTIREVLLDDYNQSDAYIVDSMGTLNNIIKKNIIDGQFQGDTYEKDLEAINTIRDGIIAKMKILTSYTDTLQIYEHILNRLEYKITGDNVDVDIDELVAEVFQYIFNDADKMVVNSKIQMITGELPVRMTKNRFFDLLGTSLNIYTGSDVEAVNDFVSMIRTTAMLDIPEGYETEYPEIYDFIMKLRNIDFENISTDEFKKSVDDLANMAEKINELVTNYLQMVEIVNVVYTAVLAIPYYMEEREGVNVAKTIISGVHDAFDSTELSEEVEESLCKLEGRQEELYEDILIYEGMLFDIRMEHNDIIKSIMQENVFEALYIIEKLLSNSLFIDLDDNKEENPVADTSYILCARDELIADFKAFFKKHSKMVNRAVMALVLCNLPVIFNSQQEIKEYIEYTLTHCNNESELMATSVLLKDIMKE